MTSARALHGPAAVLAPRPLRGRTGLRVVVTLAVVAVVTSVAGPPALEQASGLATAVSACLYLLLRAGCSAAPSGWRWYAAATATCVAGGISVEVVTGQPASSVLGVLPGSLLTILALLRLRDRCCRSTDRARLVTTSTLFFVATLLALHVVLHLVPAHGEAGLLGVAVTVVPVVLASSTAAALLFAGTTGPERARVAALLLVSHGLTAGAGVLRVLAWGTSSEALMAWVRPATVLTLVVLCLACRADVRRGTTTTCEPRERATGAASGLLPHAMALVAGSMLLLQISVTGTADAHGTVLGVIGLGAVLAHQTVMWRTQRRLTTDLLRSESYFRTLVRSSADPVVILDGRLRVSFASQALRGLLGRDPDSAVGRPIADVVHHADAPALFAALTGPVPGSVVRIARVRHADGSWRLIQATVADLREDPDVGALVLYCRDVTGTVPGTDGDPSLAELRLADPATGLPNRTALVRRVAAVRREACGRPRALALLGVPGLAALPAEDADAALRALTARLTRVLRTEDWPARTKDGDFVVLASGSVADAEVLAARLVAVAGPDLRPAAGVAALPDDLDPGEALRHADLARCAAGPGQVRRYDDAVRQQRDRREALRADLAGARDRGELRLVFQPVVDLVLQRTVTVEALLRWRHPVFGEVSPAEFVPLAEESALITELGRWVLAEACTTVAALPGPELAVAVNVSARQLHGGSLAADVLAALDASGLPARRLCLELTESMLLDDEAVVEELQTLRQMGIRVAVDDFGTGWSSLAYLVGLPVDVLKMDRQFLAGVEHDQQRQALCRAVLQLGASLGLPVVVEGVEGDAEAALLRDMGHRYLQGFALSRPLEVPQLAAGRWPTGLPTVGAGR
ncbi:putative bifunctional diguanylate cyclase/phosphodiesterase [Geodermatophilus sp. SYSU D01186]